MILVVPSVKPICNKTPCNKLHGFFFHKIIMQGTKNGPDEY